MLTRVSPLGTVSLTVTTPLLEAVPELEATME
jgi:hypothetical protein